MAGEARSDFSAFLPDGDVGAYARNLYAALKKDFTGAMKLLRNPDFQRLLVEYKRKDYTFWVAHGTQDVVSSEWLVRGLDGKEYRPEDYLIAFSKFVKAHEADIDSIGILLKHPKDWSPEALHSLREKLAAAPQRFTVPNLQKAHELRHEKALADIISMVKHAADAGNPLLTAAERVDQVFAAITKE